MVKQVAPSVLLNSSNELLVEGVHGQDILPELARLLVRMFHCALCNRYRESKSLKLFLRSGF